MKKIKNIISVFVITTILISKSFAQQAEKKDFSYSNRFSLLFGVIQPTLLKGFNVEVNYFTKRMSFDYSHGISLDPASVGKYKDQNIAMHLPFSTGFGIGYRFTSYLDLRFEPKLHSWEIYHKDDEQNKTTLITSFKTITFGLGLYYRYMPFKNSESTFLQGITTNANIRWWQNFGTTLRNDEFSFANKTTGNIETLKAPNIGIANTPIVINIGIGYTFGGK
jgi:hypothetical protein